MSEEFLSCKCSIFENVCCCPPKNGVQILQPWCQIIEDKCGCMSKVNNPFYWCKAKKSYYTYKVCVDCGCNGEPKPVSHIAIPVCESIDICDIDVDEALEECCNFCHLCRHKDFYFDDVFGGVQAPEGFKWLIIKNSGSYGNGICVLYRLTIDGRYEPIGQGIRVRLGCSYLTFDCGIADGCFKVPSCGGCSKIHVTKECNTVNNNIKFTIGVKNEEEDAITINLLDKITIPEHVTVQFTDFAGCQATYESGGTAVPLNTDVTSAVINIRCSGINIPGGHTIQKVIRLKLISVNELYRPECIVNLIPKEGVTTSCGHVPESNLPVCKKACVSTKVICNNPCDDSDDTPCVNPCNNICNNLYNKPCNNPCDLL